MEFIRVEQFQEQPLEIQYEFLKWWSWDSRYICDYDLVQINNQVMLYKDYLKEGCSKDDVFYPLFTEGQLRKFIEDKTGGIVASSCNVIGNRLINVVKKDEMLNGFKTIRRISFKEGIDLLEAYWKVACMIAKEEVDG